MHPKMTAGTLALVLVTLIVLWLGKLLPKSISTFGHDTLILAGYILITMGWVVALSSIPEARLAIVLGGWRSSWLFWGLLLGPALFVVSGIGYVASARLGFSPPAEAALVSTFQGSAVLMLAVWVVTLAVLEEWLFRGVVLDSLRSQSVVLAVVGSAAVFALYHISFFQLLPTFLLGLGLALIVVYYGAVWPAVVAHAFFNVIGVLIATMGRFTAAGS